MTATAPVRTPTIGQGVAQPGRRGRPNAARITAIDTAIHAAAYALFLEHGYVGANMDAIAVAAQVSKGTLYARYPNKEMLFRLVLERALSVVGARAARDDGDAPLELRARLRFRARKLVAVLNWREFQQTIKLLESALPHLPDLSNYWEEITGRAYVAFLAQDMRSAYPDQARADVIDWEILANMFLHGVSGWNRMESARRTVPDAEIIAVCDRAIDAMMMVINPSIRR